MTPATDLTVERSFSASCAGIDPLTQTVTLRVGAFSITIPAGSFQRDPIGHYVFGGNINGAQLAGSIWSQNGNRTSREWAMELRSP